MPAPEPTDPRVRLAISQWPDDAPRGAVSTFCAERGISRVNHAFDQVLVVTTGDDGNTIIVSDLQGEVLAEHTRPAPGITYVGNGRPPGPRPKTGEPSPKS